MTHQDASQLRERFYQGTSTREEEIRLARLLRSADCPADWTDREALLLLLPDTDESLPAGFGAELAGRLRKEARREAAVRRRRLFVRTFSGSVAAAVAICLWVAHPWPTGEPAPVTGGQSVQLPVVAVQSVPQALPVQLAETSPQTAPAPEAEAGSVATAPRTACRGCKAHRPAREAVRPAQQTEVAVSPVPPTEPVPDVTQLPPFSVEDHLAATARTVEALNAECAALLADVQPR